MSDYELLSIFTELTSNAWTIFATYVSVVFAFLVASYLVASRLRPKVVSLVITIYTLVSVWSVWAIKLNVSAIAAAVGEMKRGVQERNSSLNWVPVVATPDFMLPIVPMLITGVAVAAYAGSIVFFFYQRKGD